MRINLKKFRAPTINPSKIGSMLMLILFTAYLIIGSVIALPRVDEYFGDQSYDLLLKEDQYSKKSFIIELQVDKDDSKALTQVEEVKNIIHRRLNSFGVEEVKITQANYTPQESPTPDENSEEVVEPDYDLKYLKITVQTTKPADAVEALVSIRNYFRFYTPRPDVNFSNPEDQLAPFLQSNYTKTDFTRDSFRNVLIKKLPTTAEGEAYFAIFKPWPHTSHQFNKMMEENAGYIVGIEKDGFIEPYKVSSEFLLDRVGSSTNGSQSTNTRPEFSIGVAQDEESAKVFDLLYNSGVMPVRISLVDSEDLEPQLSMINHTEVFMAIGFSVVAILIYLSYRERSRLTDNLILLISIGAVSIGWVTILKISLIEIDLDILMYQMVGLVLSTFVIVYRGKNDLRTQILYLALIGTFAIFSEGYVKLFAIGFFYLTVGATIAVPIVRIYADKIYKLLIK